jgi:uncharacterized protein involved in response to NO
LIEIKCGVSGWYTPGIWSTPLLWSLYVALGFIDRGFALFATQNWTLISPYLAIHAFIATASEILS